MMVMLGQLRVLFTIFYIVIDFFLIVVDLSAGGIRIIKIIGSNNIINKQSKVKANFQIITLELRSTSSK